MKGRGQAAAGNERGCGDVKSKIRCSVMYQINIFYHFFLSPGPFVKMRGKSREGFEESGCLRRSERVSRPSPRQNVGMNKAVYVGTTLPCESHAVPHARALLASAGLMM